HGAPPSRSEHASEAAVVCSIRGAGAGRVGRRLPLGNRARREGLSAADIEPDQHRRGSVLVASRTVSTLGALTGLTAIPPGLLCSGSPARAFSGYGLA